MKMNGHKYKWNSMMINPYPGKFIAFEGIDGCGKSTQAKLLKNNLKELGYEIVLTCEPYANIELKNNPNLTHAWFTSYAPASNPQIALTVLIESGGEGSSAAVPVAKEFYQWWADQRIK